MAQPLPAPHIDSLSGMDVRMQALARLEAISEEAAGQESRKKSYRFLRRAIVAWNKGKIEDSGQLAMRAVNADETNARAFLMLATYLERQGYKHKALVTYQRAYELDPQDPDLLLSLGMSAWSLKMGDGAEKMFRLYIGALPDSPLGYNNLGTILSEMGRCDEAIELLRNAIYRMPHEAMLWNSLATALAEAGRAEESLVFYLEAIRLNPNFPRLYHNLGYAYQHLGRLSEALDAYREALERAADPAEIREMKHSRAICLMGMGQLAEGFREHLIRSDERFRAHVNHVLGCPQWDGEPVDGKRVLIVGEQGLGDEIMFANILPDVQRAVGPDGKLQIAVDARLIPLFQRSFPDAEVGAYEDRVALRGTDKYDVRVIPFATVNGQPDCYAQMATPLAWLRTHIEDFPRQVFLKPDLDRVARYRSELDARKPGLKVGICWRSMMNSGKRAKFFSPLDMWRPLITLPGVTFVNLQYGDCDAELRYFAEKFDAKIERIDELDLKNDIDGAAALSAALDLVISAPTAAAAVAAAVGTETWFLTAGRAWPQLGTEEYPWYRKTRAFTPQKFGDWAELMQSVAAALTERR